MNPGKPPRGFSFQTEGGIAMKHEKHFITHAAKTQLPAWIPNFLWWLRENETVKIDKGKQKFILSSTPDCQRIEYTQGMPPKQKTVDIPFENPVEMTVYVINEDNRSIMMLENENR